MLQDLIKSDKIEIQDGSNVSAELAEIDQRLAEVETNVAFLYGESVQETHPTPSEKTNSKSEPSKRFEKAGDEKEIKSVNLAQDQSTEGETGQFFDKVLEHF